MSFVQLWKWQCFESFTNDRSFYHWKLQMISKKEKQFDEFQSTTNTWNKLYHRGKHCRSSTLKIEKLYHGPNDLKTFEAWLMQKTNREVFLSHNSPTASQVSLEIVGRGRTLGWVIVRTWKFTSCFATGWSTKMFPTCGLANECSPLAVLPMNVDHSI